MTTLINRATPSQYQIFKMIIGAFKDVGNCHPDWALDKRFGSSVVKRATGTISEAIPGLLAAPKEWSDNADVTARTMAPRAHLCISRVSGGRGVSAPRLSPNKTLRKRVGMLAIEAQASGNAERYKALVDVIFLMNRGRSR